MRLPRQDDFDEGMPPELIARFPLSGRDDLFVLLMPRGARNSMYLQRIRCRKDGSVESTPQWVAFDASHTAQVRSALEQIERILSGAVPITDRSREGAA